MIDIHCHLLPGLDDGATDLQTSLAMARLAVDDGITHAILTPHVFDGVYENPLSRLHAQFANFKQALTDAGLPLTVTLGGEVHLSEQLIELVAAHEAPTIGAWEGRPVILIEMPHGHVPAGASQLLRWVIAQGLQPMIVHPERNKDVMRKPERLAGFQEMGCLFQITAGSLYGRFGPVAEAVAWHFVENGWATVVASDAHNTGSRAPNLSKARNALESRVGAKQAYALTRGHAAQILGLADA